MKKSLDSAGHHFKLDYLRDILECDNAPLVFAVSEFKLSPRIRDSEIAINNYIPFRSDQNGNRGGVIIYCRQLLNPTVISDTSPSVEAVAIKLG